MSETATVGFIRSRSWRRLDELSHQLAFLLLIILYHRIGKNLLGQHAIIIYT